MDYILQILSIFSVLLVYILSGCVVYAKVKEPYKSTPLRSFAVGAGLWIIISSISTIFFTGMSLAVLWAIYSVIVLFFFLKLSNSEEKKVCSKEFFHQIFLSFFVLIPIFVFIQHDKINLWQEFAIYAKSFFILSDTGFVTHEIIKDHLAYQLIILPVSFLIDVQDSVFACFNWFILAFVACEFVRNSGVKIKKGNILFPLCVAFSILIFLNPFGIIKHSLIADPYILNCALAMVIAEHVFRMGHLPKNIANLPAAICFVLLMFSSSSGVLLAGSLFVILLFRYILQYKYLTTQQLLGLLLIPSMSVFMFSLWEYFLNTKGYSFIPINWSEFSLRKFQLMYKALFIMSKEHLLEISFVSLILLAGLYRFKKIKVVEDLLIDKYLLRTVFWVILIYVGIGLPLYFNQYEFVAKASYSLSFGYISLIQFIVLMPLGRVVKEELNRRKIEIPKVVRVTILSGLLITIFMQKQAFIEKRDYRVTNIINIAKYLDERTKNNENVAFVDIKKMSYLYRDILEFTNDKNYFVAYNEKTLPVGLANLHKELREQKVKYLVLHAPSNVFSKNIEYNLNPEFSYIYLVEDKGFSLDKKIENKFYKDTNMII